MNTKLIALAEQRAALIAKADKQRADLSQAVAPWRGPLTVVDQGIRVAHYLERHPALLLAAAAIFAVLRPRRAVRWLRRGWLTWATVMRVRKILLGI